MNDKSHVSLEQHVCLVCGTAFDTGAILLDKRLRASMERHTATGWGLCPEHQKLADDGFVALVECDPQRSGSQAGGRMKPEQAYRTGRLAHLRRTVFAQVFNVPIADEQACVFVEPGVIEQLQSMTARRADCVVRPSVRRSFAGGAHFHIPRGYNCHMNATHKHSTHPDLVKRLKRADGHLRHVIGMIESGESCLDIARQLAAVESAVTAAKRVLIHDHIDHCLAHDEDSVLTEMKALTKLL